jgi:hypothetical protein
VLIAALCALLASNGCWVHSTKVVSVRAEIPLPKKKPEIYVMPSLLVAVTDDGVDFEQAAENVQPQHMQRLLDNQEAIGLYVQLLESLIKMNNELAIRSNAEARDALKVED